MKIDNWKTVRLGDVCESKQPEITVRVDEKVWILNLDKIEPNTGKILGYDFMNYSQLGQSVCHFNESNVLYSKLRPYLNKVVLPRQEGFATSELVPLLPCKELSRDFLAAFLRSDDFVSLISGKVAGAKMPRVVMKDFYDTKIPLPPLEEQKQIAAQLDKCTALIAKHKQMLEKYDTLIKSRFIEMFGKPLVSKGTPLSECIYINPKKTEKKDWISEFEVSFVPMTSVGEHGEISTSETRTYDKVKTGFTYFSENDVLFAKITPCMENGKGAIAKGLKNNIGFGSTEFHVLRPIENISNPYWIYYLTSFKEFRNFAEKKMTGSAGQKRVPVSAFNQILVNLPTMDLQNQFAAFVQQIDKSKFAVQKSLEKAETLYKSLMQEYFG